MSRQFEHYREHPTREQLEAYRYQYERKLWAQKEEEEAEYLRGEEARHELEGRTRKVHDRQQLQELCALYGQLQSQNHQNPF